MLHRSNLSEKSVPLDHFDVRGRRRAFVAERLRRYVQVVVNFVGVGSIPTGRICFFCFWGALRSKSFPRRIVPNVSKLRRIFTMVFFFSPLFQKTPIQCPKTLQVRCDTKIVAFGSSVSQKRGVVTHTRIFASRVLRSGHTTREAEKTVPEAGFEPATFSLGGRRAIHCATQAHVAGGFSPG